MDPSTDPFLSQCPLESFDVTGTIYTNSEVWQCDKPGQDNKEDGDNDKGEATDEGDPDPRPYGLAFDELDFRYSLKVDALLDDAIIGSSLLSPF